MYKVKCAAPECSVVWIVCCKCPCFLNGGMHVGLAVGAGTGICSRKMLWLGRTRGFYNFFSSPSASASLDVSATGDRTFTFGSLLANVDEMEVPVQVLASQLALNQEESEMK